MGQLMDRINLQKEKKLIDLSRINKTLYEVLLPVETPKIAEQILRHTVLKADIRGSTRITQLMNERGLNPASHFSMNFFDPISKIFRMYDATKIFIEGDALILALFEKSGIPESFYSVSRTCGLAQSILSIIKHYNEICQENNLPIMELGIGICYRDAPPMFLFDGDQKIMISPALNLSDRLSSCSKSVRKHINGVDLPFNLYVFQATPGNLPNQSETQEILDRYNVNGIQINGEAFEKLSREITLRTFSLDIPGRWPETALFHVGKFPNLGGGLQMLVIRESRVARVNPADYTFLEWTDLNYFEVCTNPRMIALLEKLMDE
jgi:hypothetical protein